MKDYTVVIGLEIHAELLTKSKLFCSCPNEFGRQDNASCCPGCMGMPGTLPILNREALEFSIMGGQALGCKIANRCTWDRKNYHYPDLPRAYQITQMFHPICLEGGVEIGDKFVRIHHIHLEEDAGKLVHEGKKTYIDLNRSGVPLMEIVTEPDMRSSDEAVAFVEAVREALVYAGVSDGKMEEGRLRCDANVSVMPKGATQFGTRTETKNLNSFKHIKAAIEYEVERHIQILESGGQVQQETRRFNVDEGTTTALRSKENAADYRYFPDPDILPVVVTDAEIAALKARLPEMPAARRKRYVGEYQMSLVDANTLLADKTLSDLFDKTVSLGGDPTRTLNLIKGEVRRYYGGDTALLLTADDLVYLMREQKEGKLNNEGVKKAIAAVLTGEGDAKTVVKTKGLVIEEDLGLLQQVVTDVVKNNQKAVKQYQDGDEKVFGFLIGQANRVLRGKVQIAKLQEALLAELNK